MQNVYLKKKESFIHIHYTPSFGVWITTAKIALKSCDVSIYRFQIFYIFLDLFYILEVTWKSNI